MKFLHKKLRFQDDTDTDCDIDSEMYEHGSDSKVCAVMQQRSRTYQDGETWSTRYRN